MICCREHEKTNYDAPGRSCARLDACLNDLTEMYGGETVNKRFSSILGCLMGGAVGDALGTPVEFLRWNEIKGRYGNEGIQYPETDFQQGLTLVSDDTQMTLFTANGLLMYDTRRALAEEASPEACIYAAYRDWYHCQCSAGIPRDNHSWLSDLQEMHARRAPGNTCLSALGNAEPGSVESPINNSKGCGGIMRVAPIALWADGRFTIEEADRLGAEAAALTHGHPLGYMPAAALVDVIGRLLAGTTDMYAAVADCRDAMKAIYPDDPYLGELLRIMDQAVALSGNGAGDVENINAIGEGWTGEEALGIALYSSLKYQDDFSKAVIVAVNHSGDSDSTGAIAGNIVGARLGCEAIDDRWLRNLEMKDAIHEISKDLCEGCPVDADGAITDEAWIRKYNAWR